MSPGSAMTTDRPRRQADVTGGPKSYTLTKSWTELIKAGGIYKRGKEAACIGINREKTGKNGKRR